MKEEYRKKKATRKQEQGAVKEKEKGNEKEAEAAIVAPAGPPPQAQAADLLPEPTISPTHSPLRKVIHIDVEEEPKFGFKI